MASNTTFGATIVPTPAQTTTDEITLPPPVLDSPVLTPAVSREDLSTEFPARRVPIHSPFYQHPSASENQAGREVPFTFEFATRSDRVRNNTWCIESSAVQFADS